MNQYNFPTLMYSGPGALKALANTLKDKGHKRLLMVTDSTLVKIGLVEQVKESLAVTGIPCDVFDNVHPNPIESDITGGVTFYKDKNCDSLIALGGGSPMDAAKVIRFAVCHDGPLDQYDDAKGGDKLIVNPMPPLYAIPTTAGTGSEVGRSGVVTINGTKTIFFAPSLMPDIAVLEPTLTTGLPPHITSATGIDAFVHCFEAYCAPGFHPMADGLALEGIKLIIEALPEAFENGNSLIAREKMQIAASMGATAFQKGLGMIHSLAHPLSAKYNTHHGLANALLTPVCIDFLENSHLNGDQKNRLNTVFSLFKGSSYKRDTLADTCREFFTSLGIHFGLKHHDIHESDLQELSEAAYKDPCHPTNMIPITQEILLEMYQKSY